MNKQVLAHIESTLDEIRTLYIKAATQIETLKVGEKIPATTLANNLAKDQGKTGPQIYPVLVTFFKGYPGVEVKKGAQGGIMRVAILTDAVDNSPNGADVGGTLEETDV